MNSLMKTTLLGLLLVSLLLGVPLPALGQDYGVGTGAGAAVPAELDEMPSADGGGVPIAPPADESMAAPVDEPPASPDDQPFAPPSDEPISPPADEPAGEPPVASDDPALPDWTPAGPASDLGVAPAESTTGEAATSFSTDGASPDAAGVEPPAPADDWTAATQASLETTGGQVFATPGPLDRNKAMLLFREMGNKAATDGYTPDYGADGCFWKAYEYEQAAIDRGLEPRRIHLVPGKQAWTNGTRWRYHTAVVLPVLGDDGKTRDMVFDPALASHPMPVDSWAGGLVAGEVDTGTMKDKPFTRENAYVNIVDNSHAKPANIVPPCFAATNDKSSIEIHRESANEIFEGAFPALPGGKRNPRRYEWTNDPGKRLVQMAEAPDAQQSDFPEGTPVAP